jgi:hypothetical protein
MSKYNDGLPGDGTQHEHFFHPLRSPGGPGRADYDAARRRGVPECNGGGRVTDRRCPNCGAYRAMPNPVEHSREKNPFMCLDCSTSFNAPQDTE